MISLSNGPEPFFISWLLLLVQMKLRKNPILYLTGYLHVQDGAVLPAWDENDLV